MSANVKEFKPSNKYSEIGVSGLRKQSGYIYEEYLRELQGARWQRVVKQMVNDAVIGSILFAVDTIIRQVDFSIVPGGEEKVDVEAAEFLSQCLFEDMSVSWDDTLSEILTCLPWGWSYFEIVYKQRVGDVEDETKKSNFTDGRIGWRKWAIRSQDTLDHWEFDGSGGIQGMWQQEGFSGRSATLIPIDKSLLFRTKQRKSNPEGVSILRTAYEAWYYRRNISRIEAVGIERDLAGLPVMYIPTEILQERGAMFNYYRDMVVNLRRDEQEGALLPSSRNEQGQLDVELKLLSTGGTRAFDTDKIISRYDHRIFASVLADFIMLGTQTGSYALSNDKTELFLLALGAYLKSIEGVINRQAIPRLLRLNGIKLDKMPKLEHGSLEKVDLGALGTYIKTLSDAGMSVFPSVDGRLEHRLLEVAKLPASEPEVIAEEAEREKRDAERGRREIQGEVEEEEESVENAASELRFHVSHNQKSHGSWAKSSPLNKSKGGGGAKDDGGGSSGSSGSPSGTSHRSFDSKSEMSEWGEKDSGAWSKKLSKDESFAVKEYSHVSYGSVNEHLRTGRSLDPYTQDRVDKVTKGLDSSLKKASLSENVTVYRGMNSAAFGKTPPDKLIGSTFSDKGFVSTSLDSGIATKFAKNSKNGVVVEMRLPKGTKAAYIDKLTATKGEHEVLMSRNSKFKVVGVKKGKPKTIIVEHVK